MTHLRTGSDSLLHFGVCHLFPKGSRILRMWLPCRRHFHEVSTVFFEPC